MSRLLPLLLCLLLGSLPLTASARMAGPEAWQSSDKVRDLAEIRRSGVLRVLVNQSRNSSVRSRARRSAWSTPACAPSNST